MDLFTLSFLIVAAILAVFSFVKNKDKTIDAMKKSRGMMGSMLSQIVAIIMLIGLVLTIIPPELIKTTLGNANENSAVIIAALVGSVTLIPAFVAFPLIGSLVNVGASIVPAVAFLTTLTMVGIVTFPLEKSTFGTKFAISRNILSFFLAVGIALTMGVIL